MAKTYRTSLIIQGDAKGGIKAVKATESELRRLDARTERSATTTARATKQMEGGFSSLKTSIAATGSALAAFGAVRLIRSSIHILSEFSETMQTVRAVSGATGDQFEALQNKAEELGANTRFSANEAAEGMLFLSRTGFSVNETLKAIGPSLNLAQAGALDLGTAADIVSNIMQGFEQQASQTAHATDVLTLAANSSNTDVNQLGDAMKYAAPVSHSLGISLETTAAAIGALSDAGLQATQAGTGLRSVLAALASPSTKAEKTLKQYGLTLDDLDVSQRGLVKVLKTLHDANISTSDAFKIFQRRGAAAFEVLQNQVPKVKDLTQSLEDSDGAAKKAADTMDQSLYSALKAVSSAVQANIIAFGDLGGTNELTESMQGLASVLRTTADHFDLVEKSAVTLGSVFAGRALRSLTEYASEQIDLRKSTIASLKVEHDAAAQTLRSAAADDSAALSARNLAKAEYEAARGTSAEGLALQNLRAKQVTAIETRGAYNASLAASTAATAEYTAATRVATVAASGFKRVLGFFGGPVGVAVIAASALFEFRDELGLTDNATKKATRHIKELTSEINLNSKASLNNNITRLKSDLDKTDDKIQEVTKHLSQLGNMTIAATGPAPQAAHYGAVAGYQRQLNDLQAIQKQDKETIKKYKKRAHDLDAQLHGEPAETSSATGGAGGDRATASLLNKYDDITAKIKQLQADRTKLVQAQATADPDNLKRYETAIAVIDKKIQKLHHKTKTSLTDEAKATKQLDKKYTQLNLKMGQQIALFGQDSQAAKTRYQTEYGQLAKLSPERKQHLQSMAAELDHLQRQKKAVEGLFPVWQKLERAKKLRSSISDLPQGMQAFGQRRANQLVKDAATQGLPEMQGLDAQYNGPFGEAERLEDDRAKYEKVYQERLDAFRQYAATHKQDAATAHQAIEALEKQHNKRMATYDRQTGKARRDGYEDIYSSLTDIVGTFAGRQSGIYQSLFAAEKAYHVASVLLNNSDAIAKAWASAPFPSNLPAVATTVAETGALTAAVSGVTMSGQAHDGIDNVPSSGTWNLEKGERIVDQRTNHDLKRYLKTHNSEHHETNKSQVIRIEPHIHVDAKPGTSNAEARRQGEEAGNGAKQAMDAWAVDAMRPGGLLHKLKTG